jgi:hypothetical protein
MEKNISDPRALDGRNAAAKMSEHIAFNIIFAALRASPVKASARKLCQQCRGIGGDAPRRTILGGFVAAIQRRPIGATGASKTRFTIA